MRQYPGEAPCPVTLGIENNQPLAAREFRHELATMAAGPRAGRDTLQDLATMEGAREQELLRMHSFGHRRARKLQVGAEHQGAGSPLEPNRPHTEVRDR